MPAAPTVPTRPTTVPEAAVAAYAALVGPAGAPMRRIAPSRGPIGHFGFFRSTSAETLWPEAEAVLAGFGVG